MRNGGRTYIYVVFKKRMSRVTTQASMDVRNGILSRQEVRINKEI